MTGLGDGNDSKGSSEQTQNSGRGSRDGGGGSYLISLSA